MLIQALVDYSHIYLPEQFQERAWETRLVPYMIELALDGRFLGPVERKTQVARGDRVISVPQLLSVPRSPVNRNTGLHPLLGADDIKYVLGPGGWTSQRETQNHKERHEAFTRLIAEAALATGDPCLEACARFYNRDDEIGKAREALKAVKPGSVVVLSVNGPIVLRPAVRDYWRQHYRRAFNQRIETGGMGECLISGKFGRIAPTHDKIKGLSRLGGQAAGVSLMSFDKEAFCSYGWDQNQNSPVSPDCAMAYVLALNELLRPGSRHRKDVAGIGFIFWLKRNEDFNLFDLLDKPTAQQMEALLGPSQEADSCSNMFYMAAVSGNGGRLRVRYWVADTLANVKRNLREWFDGLKVSGIEDGSRPVRFWQLLQVIHRAAEPPAHQVISLLRRAVEGRRQALGHEMLAASLQPLQRAGTATIERLGLIRLCVNDFIHAQQKGEKEMAEALDPEQINPAYICGRLFAEYEGLQTAAHRAAGESQANVSIADHCYGLASTRPAAAFPQVETLSRKYLRKLRRDNPETAAAIIQRIQDLHHLLEQAAGYRFPAILAIEDQGRFALGYHHQRTCFAWKARAQKEGRPLQEGRGGER